MEALSLWLSHTSLNAFLREQLGFLAASPMTCLCQAHEG